MLIAFPRYRPQKPQYLGGDVDAAHVNGRDHDGDDDRGRGRGRGLKLNLPFFAR